MSNPLLSKKSLNNDVDVGNVLDSESEYGGEESFEVDAKGQNLDPTECKEISLGTDFYSLTWYSIKKGTFNGKYIRGVKIYLLPQDYFWLYINFFTYVIALLLSVVLLIQEALIDDIYIEGDWQMDLLRIFLVVMTQINLSAELELAYAKFLYPIVNPDQFYHPTFAVLIGFSHIMICCVTMLGLIMFICMADEFADPIINFSGICVLVELDDWIGDAIMSTKIERDRLDRKYEEEEKDIENDNWLASKTFDISEETKKRFDKILKARTKYNTKNINENLSIISKMSLITEGDLVINIDEKLYTNAPFYIVLVEKLVSIVPWKIVLPLSTIPISYALPYFTVKIRTYFGYSVNV